MSGAKLTAVLGPTNTGKTHLAVSRMCGHASGMIGFPLRLLAREVYDRVVELKGAAQVALLTGEEKILPPNARYFLCTAESMPTDRDVAFVALDEAQLAADPERGHVFTDRLLHRRGREETMLLGSDVLRPLVRRLLPEFDIDTRPRFSTLGFAGARKLSRLPKRSAVVAFSAGDVYAIAEMLRRQKGGAAVVMGALSPRTRNAQVELYQSGEVDYLVATDAIGMGLNMDIAHVAFAALTKFDGRRPRRLYAPEMAQIAGRAGRFQTDGTFGTLVFGETGSGPAFEPQEVAAIEAHDFMPLERLVWRNARLEWRTLAALVASLERAPPGPEFIRSQRAADVAVLKALAKEEWVQARANSPARLQLLWAACGLPDYRATGPRTHALLVGRIYRHLTDGAGHLPTDWIASELARLEDVAGDIETIAGRIAAARTWTYLSHREAWLEDPAHWAARARGVEDRLSDALHERLTQRFVDRRTAVLLKELGAHEADLPVLVEADGAVVVGGEYLGRLNGFRFEPDPLAKAGERRRLMAAAERRLGGERERRAAALVAASDSAIAMRPDKTGRPSLFWDEVKVGRLAKGPAVLKPRIKLAAALKTLAPATQEAVKARLSAWLSAAAERHLQPLAALAEAARARDVTPTARGLAMQLVEALGILPRARVVNLLAAMTDEDRALLRRAGVIIGVKHLFLPALIRPEPTRLRLAFAAVLSGAKMRAPPAPGLNSHPASGRPAEEWLLAGFMLAGERAVRLDMVERLAQAMHKARKGGKPFLPDGDWRHRLGIDETAFGALMHQLGYRAAAVGAERGFRWQGMGRRGQVARQSRAYNPHSPFAALADLRTRSRV